MSEEIPIIEAELVETGIQKATRVKFKNMCDRYDKLMSQARYGQCKDYIERGVSMKSACEHFDLNYQQITRLSKHYNWIRPKKTVHVSEFKEVVALPDVGSIESSSEDRCFLITKEAYRQKASDDLSKLAQELLDSISSEDISDASLREKMYAVDMALKNARLQANMSTENIAHNVPTDMGNILRSSRSVMLKRRFSED